MHLLYGRYILPYSNKTIRENYHKQYWKQNKDRYKRRWLTRLGNPKQDEQILTIIALKRQGKKTISFDKLKDSHFKYNNQALLPRYKDEIVKGVIDYGF